MNVMEVVRLAGGIAGLIAVVGLWQMAWFHWLPKLIVGNKLGKPGLCQYLELVVATPSVLGERSKLGARHDLLRLLNHKGSAERALHHGEQILMCHLPIALESEIRLRMADALETLGRMNEARWQRNRAKAVLEAGDKDAVWYMNRGRALESQRDYAGACESFSMAIELTEDKNQRDRSFGLLSLAIAEFHAGRIEDSARHAEEAVGLAEDSQIRLLALRQASAAYGDGGHIEDSERFDRLSSDLARRRGDRKALAESLGHLAENLRKRGRLDEALEALEEAGEETGMSRQYHMVKFQIMRSAGSFDEGLRELEAAECIDQLGLGRGETKSRGILDFAAARMQMELGRLDEASDRLNAAKKALAEEPKLLFWCLAGEAYLSALEGRLEESMKLMERIEAEVGLYVQDKNTQLVAFAGLGRAAEILGQFERGSEAWRRYLDVSPNPVDIPIGLYHLGECRRGLGDEKGAREYFERAVALGLQTHESGLARARLSEL